MCSGADIPSEVDAPQLRAVEAVTVEDHVAGVSVVGIVVRVGRFPFQYQLVVAVTLHVSHATVVRRVGILSSVGGDASFRPTDWHTEEEVVPWCDLS